jgi:tetratricopeptide (TPR) repeat protein
VTAEVGVPAPSPPAREEPEPEAAADTREGGAPESVAVEAPEPGVREEEYIPLLETSPALPLVVAAKEAREFDEKLVLLRQAIKMDPDHPQALWDLAQLYHRHLQFADSAQRTYREFRERFPNDPRVVGIPGAARWAVERTRPENVPAGVRGAMEAEPTKTPAGPSVDRQRQAIEVWARGLEYHNAQNWKAAVEHYQRALDLDNTLISASFNLGLVRKAMGDLERARDAFNYTLTIQPDMLSAGYMLGVVYRDMGENGRAVTELNRVLRIKPDYDRAHYLLGSIYRHEQHVDLARMHFERYLELAPDGTHAGKAREWLATVAH